MPLALACVGPLAMIIGLPFIPGTSSSSFPITPADQTLPESPRYLALAGRNDEAWEVVRTLHRDPTDFEDEAARAEFTQIIRQTDYDKELGYGYVKMFTRPSWRRRSLLAMFLM
jgi:hypothetical protein